MILSLDAPIVQVDISNEISDSQGSFDTTAQVATGLGAGALAGIIIGVVAFVAAGGVGAKKGFDAYKSNKISRSDIKDNPLYEQKRKSGRNPFYEGKVDDLDS